MLIQEVISSLLREKNEKIPSRFPCRAIMTKNIMQYTELLDALKKMPDVQIVPSSELYKSADVMPRYTKIIDMVQNGKWIVLTGVSEYFMLFHKYESEKQRFADLWRTMLSSDNLSRILIPLWGCETQWFDDTLHLCDERQKVYYYDCSDHSLEEQKISIIVLSGLFEPHINKMNNNHGIFFTGLREWHEYWEQPSCMNNEFVLLTNRFEHIQPFSGNINIRVIKDIVSYDRECLNGGDKLSEKNCSPDAAEILLKYALNGDSLDSAILSDWNMSIFSEYDLMSKWNTMTKGQKELSVIWYQFHQDDSYLCYCIKHTEKLDDLYDNILHNIFQFAHSRPSWLNEWCVLVEKGNIIKDCKFFEQLDEVAEYENKLQFLTNKTVQERQYLLHMVGLWMRYNLEELKSNNQIKNVYPELYAYIYGAGYDTDAERYFSAYKQYKLSNQLPEDETLYFAGYESEDYDKRYTVMHSFLSEDCRILWIDALGAEWLPLLLWSLKQDSNCSITKYFIAQAEIPTETCYNNQWTKMSIPYDKLDKLDKLAHKGTIDDPDYYSCVEEQIVFVSETIKKSVDMLLKHNRRIIITGDHGTSRLAARFFHTRLSYSAPIGSIIGSHGRFCETAEKLSDNPLVKIQKKPDGGYFNVFKNYDHFKKSGYGAGADDNNPTYGEIHGGASPEEILVPVIVLDSKHIIEVTAKWDTPNPIKISSKKVKVKIIFTSSVSNLMVSINGIDGECSFTTDKNIWNVLWKNLKPGIYPVRIIADGRVIEIEDLIVVDALSNNEFDDNDGLGDI